MSIGWIGWPSSLSRLSMSCAPSKLARAAAETDAVAGETKRASAHRPARVHRARPAEWHWCCNSVARTGAPESRSVLELVRELANDADREHVRHPEDLRMDHVVRRDVVGVAA